MLLILVTGLLGQTPAGATAPGANGRIAYSRFAGQHADIVSANPDGTGVVKLTSGPAGTFDLNPDWSPDGTRIAFERDAGASQAIFIMNADGSDLRQITFDAFPGDMDPAWSPDGTRIAVERFDSVAGRDGIYIMSADGSHPIQVTQSDALLGENVEPQWAPDGTKLVFEAATDTKGHALFTVNLDGSGVRRLTPWRIDAVHPGRTLDRVRGTRPRRCASGHVCEHLHDPSRWITSHGGDPLSRRRRERGQRRLGT
jgi:Tol biopolymer transport system component